jgi:hypothetical protein
MSLPLLHSHICLTPWSVFQDGSPVCVTLDNLRSPVCITPVPRELHPNKFGWVEKEPRCCRVSSNELLADSLDRPEFYLCRIKLLSHNPSDEWITDSRFPFDDFRYFNSPFEVLFNFPSRYLFAIDLSSIFSRGWRLPPVLRSTPKERDS